jgi:integrase
MKPLIIRKGWAEVRIYECTVRNKYLTYFVCWRVGKQRMRRGLASLTEAKREAKTIVEQLADGSALPASGITMRDLQYYRTCESMLNGVPLDRAIKGYLKNNPSEVKEIRISELVEEFLAKNEASVNSNSQKITMRALLTRFASKISKPVSLVTASDLDEYLSDPRYAPRTRHNQRSAIIVLFNYARRKGYLSDERKHAAEKTEEIKFKKPPVEIYSAEQAEAMLTLCDSKLVPFLAIGLFAGIRSAELARLKWENIDWVGGTIRLDREITKTNQSRLAPLMPNLAEWLAPYKGMTGNILATTKSRYPTTLISPWLASQSKPSLPAKWIDNGMRHSFASYHLAYTQNAAQTALACGHSVGMLLGTYKTITVNGDSLNTEVARKYFEIRPKLVDNVIPIKSHAKPQKA